MLQGALCGSATSGLWSILESFFGVEENIKEKQMADAQSLRHLLKVQKAEREVEAQCADLSVKKGKEPEGDKDRVPEKAAESDGEEHDNSNDEIDDDDPDPV